MQILDRPAPARQKMLRRCMDNFGVGDRQFDWPNNLISTKAIIYESGAIARTGSREGKSFDRKELELCKKLARRAIAENKHLSFDIGSEEVNPLWDFYVIAAADEKPRK